MKLFTLSLLIGSLGFIIHAGDARAQAATEYRAMTGSAAGLAGKLGEKLDQGVDRNLSSVQTDTQQNSNLHEDRELVNGARIYPRGK